MMDITETLHQGIAAAEAGRRAEARALLTAVVKTDENQLEAWWWLSQVMDSLESQVVCLENVLTLDPTHPAAQAELDRVKARQTALFGPVYQEEDDPSEAAPVAPVEGMPLDSSGYPLKDEFDNEWLCPYCTARTRPADKSCPKCRRSLVVSKRVKTERSVWLWRGILLQFMLAFYLIALGAAHFTLRLRGQGIADPLPFLPLYFGLPVEQPAALTQQVLRAFPRPAFWSLMGAILYSTGLLLLLYLRLPYGNVFYLIHAGMMLVVGLLGALFFYDTTIILVTSIIGIMLGIGQLVITFNLWSDFTFKSSRLLLKVDGGIKNHASFYLSGRKYSELGMWGAALIHLRRAVVRNPGNLSYRAALVVAYMNIKRYDLARQALQEAEQLYPDAPEVKQLGKKLAAVRTEDRR